MKDNILRVKAWTFSQEFKKQFKEAGDRQAEQLFATTELILTQDAITFQKFLNLSMDFVKEELAKAEASDN